MRVRRIQGSGVRHRTTEAILLHVDGEDLWLIGENINMGDVMAVMEELRESGCQDVGMPIGPPPGGWKLREGDDGEQFEEGDGI